jgi:biopolymer transport protein ExbD
MSHTISAGDDDAITGINVTPFVDIALVLLIIFMVTAKLTASHAIPTDLPKAASAEQTQTVFTVSIDPDGHVKADGRDVDDAALRAAGVAALAKDHDVRTVVQGSARASHGAVIHVVDELRRAGVVKVGFAVERVDE